MGLKPGQTNNKAGKPKGAKNKIDADLRKKVTDFLSGKFPDVMNQYELLAPKDKVKFYTEMLQYGLPKLQSVDMTMEIDKTLSALNDEQLDAIIEKLTS
ncbi:hypothetical protein BDD43_3509 [Mucilaginibacter gracilis]|uniref:DUF5681 domain-containing protein n=1 Tax=Mucilaginibacter gracilis TaxID=423350 RepID=A0A495J4P1_9SPHI|nr:hypothetical protein [Mucilaginibacter gracilis]RKR83304.1 hypothetical protein BDD43_3509 [Mucilaginibacter gracilis]